MTDRYRAFISYSHADEKWAAWLQRSLERFRVPKRLLTDHPALPRRLNPVFRDKDELASSTDLGDSIRKAMERSDALIIVCSPNAYASRWVNEEIRVFRELAPGCKILCLIVDGSPDAGAPNCAFPPALLTDEKGNDLPEPLAADIRSGADGKRGAFLKVTAGLLGLGIDDLKQRDQQRKIRTLSALAGLALTIAVFTTVLAINVYWARQESEVRRDQAEELIQFMLVELRSKLEPIDKLDILDAVGDQALEYFAALGEHGSREEVLSRAMTLRQIGEVRFSQGRLEPAMQAFTESRDINAVLHAGTPEDNEILFELGQAEFWVGYTALEQGNHNQVEQSFIRYMDFSQILLSRDPENPDYQLELMYAYSNLGTNALNQNDAEAALQYFQQNLELNIQLVDKSKDDRNLQYDLAETYSWKGSALLQLHRLTDAQASYQEAFNILKLLTSRYDRPRYKEELGDLARLLADIHLNQGHQAEAEALISVSNEITAKLVAHDPDNSRWQRDQLRTQYRILELASIGSTNPQLEVQVSLLVDNYLALHMSDDTNLRIIEELTLAERLAGIVQMNLGNMSAALAHLEASHARMESLQKMPRTNRRTLLSIALVNDTLGVAVHAENEPERAADLWETGLKVLGNEADDSLDELAVRRQLYERLGNENEAKRLAETLSMAGFEDPRYVSGLQN